MVGRLAETLGLTKRIERFQILHATLLLIGGVRRIRPEYCQQAITSFPLHSFYNDTIRLTPELTQAALLDVVLENYPTDTLLVNTAFSAAILETLLIYSLDDSISLGMGAVSASIIDTVKEYSLEYDNVAIGIDFGVGTSSLIDNVIETNQTDTVGIGLGSLNAILEDV